MPAIAALERRGFIADFVPDGDRVRIAGTQRRLGPDDVRLRDYYRFEGTSDPDSMSVIYAVEARDGTRGTGPFRGPPIFTSKPGSSRRAA
jgi:hypothetical protein